ncbi:hypothetical protein L6164_023893 [Bauhinia variegata]|uniref:Uncharacterized protein n=1 Tax=Bauhinia variegata TaxID=167791 RepID=A0ACB9MND6_BAUVA|nr:hypothetical protein L6164_023893 [Bauhinia variegata]
MAVDDQFTELIPKTCVVLGGRGFLGRSLVLMLLKLGKWMVRVADSALAIQIDQYDRDSVLSEALLSGRASYFHVDLRNKRQIVQVIEGASVVFFMDTTDLNTNDFCSCYAIIVQGAKNVIKACQECRVQRLIYNSSADVVFDGSHDIYNGDESLAYPWKMENMLGDLKAQAEALILSANDIDGLSTCALRPSNVFGPGETEFVPFFVKLAKSGLAKFIIGSGDNLSDFTYSENVSHAHICAEEALVFQLASVGGKAFFITNLEPMKFWDFLSLLLGGLGYQRPFIKLPAKMGQYILLLLKWAHKKLELGYFNYPLIVRFILSASHTRTFNCAAAHKYIGYSPIVSLEEGVALTIESFSHLARDSLYSRYCSSTGQSKAEKLLGNGKVASILLWRDEMTSFTYFLALIMLFYWFFLSGRTFASSTARLLLLATVILYGYAILPSNIFGFTIQRMSLSSFDISDAVVEGSITTTVYLWNKGFQNIRILAQGDDWSMFFKVAVSLFLLKLILSHSSLTTLIGIALVFAFTAFFVYEQYEAEIDGLVEALFKSLKGSMIILTRNLPESISSLLHNDDNFQPSKAPGRVKGLR